MLWSVQIRWAVMISIVQKSGTYKIIATDEVVLFSNSIWLFFCLSLHFDFAVKLTILQWDAYYSKMVDWSADKKWNISVLQITQGFQILHEPNNKGFNVIWN